MINLSLNHFLNKKMKIDEIYIGLKMLKLISESDQKFLLDH